MLYKHEDLSSNPQYSGRKLGMAAACNPELWGGSGDRRMVGIVADQKSSSGLRERLCPKRIRWRVIEQNT